jgi:hypothetical protein
MSTSSAILLAHVLTTLFMCGVIWFVQLVHYPLFDLVGRAGFETYEREHARRTTWVVAPPMLIELITAGALLWIPSEVPLWKSVTGLGLLGLIWSSTAFWQVPRHRELAAGFTAPAHRALVRSNWFRTLVWSLRAVLVLTMISSAGRAS